MHSGGLGSSRTCHHHHSSFCHLERNSIPFSCLPTSHVSPACCRFPFSEFVSTSPTLWSWMLDSHWTQQFQGSPCWSRHQSFTPVRGSITAHCVDLPPLTGCWIVSATFGCVNSAAVDIVCKPLCGDLSWAQTQERNGWTTWWLSVHSLKSCLSQGGSTTLHPTSRVQAFWFLYLFPNTRHSLRGIPLRSVSPVTNGVECLFMFFLTTCVNSLEKCLFRSFIYF